MNRYQHLIDSEIPPYNWPSSEIIPKGTPNRRAEQRKLDEERSVAVGEWWKRNPGHKVPNVYWPKRERINQIITILLEAGVGSVGEKSAILIARALKGQKITPRFVLGALRPAKKNAANVGEFLVLE